jgi:hypothetical protein
MVEFLNRYVALGKEAGNAYGTEVAPTAFGEVDDESFATRMDLLTRQDMSRPVVGKSVTGKEYSEGGYNMAVQLDEFLGNTLAAFFPLTAVTGSSPKTHSFKEPVTAATDTYNSYTIDVGREEKVHTYTGMVANTLSVTASVGEYVMMSADFVGCREKASQADIAAVTFEGDALDALYFSNGTVFFDNGDGSDQTDVSAAVKSIDFQVSLNPDTDNAMALGDSTYSSKPKMQRREVTGTVEFNKVLYGAQATDEPDYTSLIASKGLAYNDGSAPVMILHFTEEDSPTANYIKFNFYNIRWEAPTSNVSGRDSQTMSVGFVALYDNDKGCMDIEAKGGALGDDAY